MGPAHDRRTPRVGDAEIPEDDLVDGEGVGAGVDMAHVGRTAAPHDAERAVGDRCPGVDDGEVGCGDVEQHHRRRAEVRAPPRVHGLVDRPGAAFEAREAQMRELGRVGTQLRHHDADVRVEPGRADRLLDEPALVAVRAEVPADVDDAIFHGVESEVRRHLRHRAVLVATAVHSRCLKHRHVGPRRGGARSRRACGRAPCRSRSTGRSGRSRA